MPTGASDGTQTWDTTNKTWGKCVISKCDTGYNLYDNKCYSDQISCTSDDENAASGFQNYQGNGKYGECHSKTCKQNFVLSLGSFECVPEFITCDPMPDHAEEAYQQYIEHKDDYHICTIKSCEAGYALDTQKNKCVETQ